MNSLRDGRALTPTGFPHSEILGSKPVCGSPRLIAAYRVLRRLSAPRHPPCTLSSLTKLEFSFFRRILSLLTRFSCQRTFRRGQRPPAWKRADHAEIRGAMASFAHPPRPAHRASQIALRLERTRASLAARCCHLPPADRASNGGADRARTDDLRLARAALSQLSYSPARSSSGRPARCLRPPA